MKRPSSATSLGLGQRGETSNLVRDLWQTPGGICPGGPMNTFRRSPPCSPFRGSGLAVDYTGSLAIPTPDSSSSSGEKNCRVLRLWEAASSKHSGRGVCHQSAREGGTIYFLELPAGRCAQMAPDALVTRWWSTFGRTPAISVSFVCSASKMRWKQ